MTDEIRSLQRHPSGIAALDALLGGGLFVGGIYLVMGHPGLGKTILGNQLAFSHVARGGKAIYVTLLAESHTRMLLTMEGMTFFNADAVGGSLQYISGYQVLEKDKLSGLIQMLRKAARDQKASLLVLDGLVTVGAHAESEIELKKFIHELQALSELVRCTTVLLTGSKDDGANYAERTMVDGLISLRARRIGMQSVREIEVTKHRGTAHVTGASFYEISAAGLHVYPRTEAIVGLELTGETKRRAGTVSTGIKTLDGMLYGGLRPRSSTMVLGSPGSGKTLLGLSFLDQGAQNGDPGLHFGFFESPDGLVAKASSIGIDLARALKTGRLQLQWHRPQEQIADRLADKLLETIRKDGIKRLFIDGIQVFYRALLYPDRMAPFLTSLTNELRNLSVTTVLSDEIGSDLEISVQGAAASVESIVLLRYVEREARLRRLISVMKMREGAYDSSLREFVITDRGLDILGAFHEVPKTKRKKGSRSRTGR